MSQKVSSETDPQLAAQMAEQFLKGGSYTVEDGTSPLLMPRPPSNNTVTLYGGLMTSPDEVVREAEVRELTGADEEALARQDSTKNLGRFMTTLLKCGVVRIGDKEPPDKASLDSLLIGDRDLLMYHIRLATYGSEMEFGTQCVFCTESLDVVLDLEKDVPMRDMEEPDRRAYEVELRNGRKAVVNLPCGGDQELVLGLTNKSVPEMNTILLGRCLLSIDGVPAIGNSAARNLGMADRKLILDFIANAQPGPRYEEVKVPCPACEREVPLRIGLADLFRG